MSLIVKVITVGGFLYGLSQVFGQPAASKPAKLGPYQVAEQVFGEPSASAPVVLLLHDEGSSVDQAFKALGDPGVPCRVLAPLGDRIIKDGFGFVDPLVQRAKGELDAAARLTAAASDALMRFSPQRKILVAGFGASGSLAALLALYGGIAVQGALGAGGVLVEGQLPTQAGVAAPVVMLAWGPQLKALTKVADAAAKRDLDLTVVEYDGEHAPDPGTQGDWLRQRIAAALTKV